MGNDLQLKFINFEPGPDIQNFVSLIGERLHLSAPSDAALRLVISKSKDAFQVSCKIVSRAGTFVADAISESPVQAVRRVEVKIRQQLKTWIRHRYQPHTERSA